MSVSPPVVIWRVAHALTAVGFLASIGYVWWCALTGRKGPLLGAAIGALVAEGACVAGNHGDCPLGKLGDRVGDQVPLFELVLSPAAARRAIPALGAVTFVGIGVLWWRSGELKFGAHGMVPRRDRPHSPFRLPGSELPRRAGRVSA